MDAKINERCRKAKNKITIICYLKSLKRRIVERILRHFWTFFSPTADSIRTFQAKSFRDQTETKTFGHISRDESEHQLSLHLSLNHQAWEVHTYQIGSNALIRYGSPAPKWTFVCFLCQNNLQPFTSMLFYECATHPLLNVIRFSHIKNNNNNNEHWRRKSNCKCVLLLVIV